MPKPKQNKSVCVIPNHNNTKLGGLAHSLESTKAIQDNLNRIQKWEETCQMKFNTTKCKDVGSKHVRQNYFMGGTKLQKYKLKKTWG